MKRLIESFENFFLIESANKRLPTMFDVFNEWLTGDGFRLVGRYNVQTNEGKSALFTYRHDIAGSPFAFILNGDSSMYIIWDHALATLDAKERQNSRGRKTKKDSKIEYYVKNLLSPYMDNHKLDSGAYVDLRAVRPPATKYDNRDRPIIPDSAGWAFYHGPNKRQKSADYVYDFQAGDTTVGSILKDLFVNMKEVYVVRQTYEFQAYIPFEVSQSDLDKMEYYKKFIDVGFVRCGVGGQYEEYSIHGTKMLDDEIYLLLPIDSVEWFNQRAKKQIYSPDENGVATIHITIEGRVWVDGIDGREGLATGLVRRRGRSGSLMTADDWNTALSIAWEWFEDFSQTNKENFATHGANSTTSKDDIRINNDLNAAIDELW